MIQTIATLIDRRTFGPSQELRLRAPVLARALLPGQAVLVKAGWGVEPSLRRTFYPIALDDETWTLRVPPGADWGHAWLRGAALESRIDCLGPVGNGFSLPDNARNLLFLGEGDATWALLPAIARADAGGRVVTLAMEALSARDLLPAQRLPETVEYQTVVRQRRPNQRPGSATSLDGVAQYLPELLLWADAVLAAGSLELYARLTIAIRAARYELSRGFAQVHYPATFVCGVGACQACVADLAAGRRRICQRGPVLDLADVTRDEGR
jgi:dihydroorotate dehydrogenase electron transfer subunit